ncbi:hypothetical protein L9F63_016189 [Diploptera punctata]|uniref:Uncharacterized protein n=1 Tax=Diploptera punctata TaxID=6984 RepID=A0AAD8EHT0_DIPPU|nr:hypothetical protein L9F63_016189 [Diploptera punctata]
MVAELSSITSAVASNNSHKSASSAGGRLSHLPQWIQTATKDNTHNYTSSADNPMYTSVTKPNKSNLHKNQNESSKRDDVGFWRHNDVPGTSTDPVGLLNRQGPVGRGLLRACRALSSDDFEDDNGDRIRSDSGGVSDSGRMFILRDEELVEESEYRRSQEDLSPKSRKRPKNSEEEGVEVSPTPGRENWRLRESKRLTSGNGDGGDDRRGISMTDIWPKDWGSKWFLYLHFFFLLFRELVQLFVVHFN